MCGIGPTWDRIGVQPNDRLEEPPDLLRIAVVSRQQDDDRASLGQGPHGGEEFGLVGHVGGKIAVEAQDLDAVVDRMCNQTAEHHLPVLVQPIVDRGHHAEIPAATAQRPVKIRVLLGTCCLEAAVRGNDVERQHVVNAQPELSHQPAFAPAERQPGDAGVGDHPARRRQAEDLRLAVELAPEHPGLRGCDPLLEIEANALHRRHVDNDAAIDNGVASHVVGAAPYGQGQAAITGGVDCGDHVSDPTASHDERRVAVDVAVPYAPRTVVLWITGHDHGRHAAFAQPLRDTCRHRYPLCVTFEVSRDPPSSPNHSRDDARDELVRQDWP